MRLFGHDHVRVDEHHVVALRLPPAAVSLRAAFGSLFDDAGAARPRQLARRVPARVIHDDRLDFVTVEPRAEGAEAGGDVVRLVLRRNDNRQAHQSLANFRLSSRLEVRIIVILPRGQT